MLDSQVSILDLEGIGIIDFNNVLYNTTALKYNKLFLSIQSLQVGGVFVFATKYFFQLSTKIFIAQKYIIAHLNAQNITQGKQTSSHGCVLFFSLEV